MKNINDFQSDLEFGKYFEKKCLPYLLPYENVEFAPDRRFADWDLKVKHTNGETISYECKADRCVRKTGNFYIEVSGKNGEKSGLQTTKADYYILIKPTSDNKEVDELYEVSIDAMREFYNNAKPEKFRHSFSGAYGFLLSEKELIAKTGSPTAN
jgi:hypothetical protein